MKRRLIRGLGLITLIFVLSGVVVLRNLAVITKQRQLEWHHEDVVSRYKTMSYLMRSAQTELYRHQAGYTRDINELVDNMLEFEDLLSLTKKDYLQSHSRADCIGCHAGGGGSSEAMLEHMTRHLNAYEDEISLMVTSKDPAFTDSLEKAATADGDEIIGIVDNLRKRTVAMSDRIERRQTVEIEGARASTVIALGLGSVLAVIVGLLLLRSITRPVDLLLKGIRRVSSGDFDSKVVVASDDEIGFLASTFNAMTDNLARTTRQKEALFAELQEVNNSLEQRVWEATEQLKIAHEKMLRSETLSAVGTFASGVAHELATPLSSVLSYFQMVKGRIATDDERLGQDISLIEGELVRCRSILRGMLDFAKAPETEKSATNVNAIISELLALVQYQKEYRGITVVQELDHSVPDVMAVSGQLKQVFLNLILNALQSMEKGGLLTVSSSTVGAGEDKRVVVRVADTGAGIPAEETDRIFQPFYTTRKSGTGLGLAISYGIIRSHGGEIEVQSETGKGTTFSVYLPAVGNHEEHEDYKIGKEI